MGVRGALVALGPSAASHFRMSLYTLIVAAVVLASVTGVWRWWNLAYWPRRLRKAWRTAWGKDRRALPQWKRRLVYWRDARRCVGCRTRVSYEWRDDAGSLEVDHRFPWSWGGSDSVWNLQAACRTCNRRKGASRVGI